MSEGSHARVRLASKLLSVPVLIECSRPEDAAHFSMCYAASPGDVEALRPLHARLRPPAEAGGSFLVDIEGREVRAVAGETEARRAFHHELMHGVMLRRTDLLYLHAAVVEAKGRAFVLAGRSQSGKSTLALALVMRGARLLSDELFAYDPHARRALAFPRALKIRDVCAGYFPELSGRFVGSGEGRFLPFPELCEGCVADSSPIGWIALPRWSRSDPLRCEEFAAGRAVLELLQSTLNFGMHQERSIDLLADLVSQARVFDLSWSEPGPAADLLMGQR